MPLTFPAHQLLVVPLVRGGKSPLPGVALLLGTARPDFAFCVGGYQLNALSHLAYGPLLMAPLGLLLYAWIEALFLPALATALPASGRWPLARLCITRGLPSSWRGWAWTLAALVIGAYSHLLFDGFTHANMWPASVLYPNARLEVVGLGHTHAAAGLQRGFSVVASLIVLSWAHRAMMAAPACAMTPRWGLRFGAVLGATLLGAALGTGVGLAIFGAPQTSRQMVLLLMSPLVVGAFAGATLAAWKLRPRLRDDGAASGASSASP